MVHGTLISSSILLTSAIMLYLAIKICNKIAGWMNISNALYLFMINYVVYAFIGSAIFNVWHIPSCEGYLVYERLDLLVYVFLITSFGLLAIPCFTALFYRAFGFSSNRENVLLKEHCTDFQKLKIKKSVYAVCWFIYLICFVVLVTYLKKIGGSPILYIAKSAAVKSLLRSDATNNFSGKLWRYILFYREIPLYLLILSSFFQKKTLFTVLFCHNCFVAVMNFEKSPLMNIIILMLILYAIQHKKLPIKLLVRVFLLALVLLLSMYILFMGSHNLTTAMLGMAQRLFTGQIVPFTWYFRYVERNDFLFGTSFPNPGGIFPFKWVRLTVEVMNLYYSSIGRITEEVGSMPTVFMAEWYANFGIFGVLVSFLLFSFILACIDVFCVRTIKKTPSPFSIGIYVYLIFFFQRFAGTGFSGLIVDMAFIVPLALNYFLCRINNSNQQLFKLNVESSGDIL